MAEDPSFGGFSSGDAAKTFAKVIAKIKSDMAAIEASAKNIEASLGKASKHATGWWRTVRGPEFGGAPASPSLRWRSSLGAITNQLGGGRGRLQPLRSVSVQPWAAWASVAVEPSLVVSR